MGLDPFTIAVAAAFVTVGTGVYQYQQNREALKNQRRQARAESTRSRRRQIRAARIAQASAINQAAQTGAAGSSAEAGAVSDVATQVGSNLSFITNSSIRQENIFDANQKSATAGLINDIFSAGEQAASAAAAKPSTPQTTGSTVSTGNAGTSSSLYTPTVIPQQL